MEQKSSVTMDRLSGKISRANAKKSRGRTARRLEARFDRAEAAVRNKRPSAAGWHGEASSVRGPRAGRVV